MKSDSPVESEKIVVDNSSRKEMIENNQKLAEFYHCKYVSQPITGLSLTKNVGVKASKGALFYLVLSLTKSSFKRDNQFKKCVYFFFLGFVKGRSCFN